jgi:hypothetical protein
LARFEESEGLVVDDTFSDKVLTPGLIDPRLKAYEASLGDPEEMLFTWGYHEAFCGKLTRAMLDEVSASRLIIVWQRSGLWVRPRRPEPARA